MWGGASCQGRVSWCVKHTIGDSGIWGGTWNSQGALLVLFAGEETAEFKKVAVYQCGISCKVESLYTCVAVMIKNGDGENRIMQLMVIPCMRCEIHRTLDI